MFASARKRTKPGGTGVEWAKQRAIRDQHKGRTMKDSADCGRDFVVGVLENHTGILNKGDTWSGPHF